jgi:LmbE family N-acetylglucosaminyl deacetylase
MLTFGLPKDPGLPLKLLFLGAHCDDIEIGCGGTVLQLASRHPKLDVTWVVFSSTDQREQEARAGASLFLEQATGQKHLIIRDFRDGFFPYQGPEIKEFFEDLKKELDPDLIFTHYRGDRHQDHRTISDLTWNTWRGQLILEYEIPKYDGDLGTPNFFVPLEKDICARKARYICNAFQSEGKKAWMTEDIFIAVLRLRGVECAAPEKHAEAFHCRKLVLRP